MVVLGNGMQPPCWEIEIIDFPINLQANFTIYFLTVAQSPHIKDTSFKRWFTILLVHINVYILFSFQHLIEWSDDNTSSSFLTLVLREYCTYFIVISKQIFIDNIINFGLWWRSETNDVNKLFLMFFQWCQDSRRSRKWMTTFSFNWFIFKICIQVNGALSRKVIHYSVQTIKYPLLGSDYFE